MNLEEEIQDRLVADTESILQHNLERVEEIFKFHGDGTINISEKYGNIDPENEILIYLVAQRFAKEGNIDEGDSLTTDFFYKRIDRSDRTVRKYLQRLREKGLVKKEGKSSHRIIIENLPDALDRINNATDNPGDAQ